MAKHDIHLSKIRNKLPPRRNPYWARIERGLHIGFRKLDDGTGTWIGRRTGDDYKYKHKSVGYADSIEYDDAVKAIRAWAKQLDNDINPDDVKTVSDACRFYVRDRRRETTDANAGDIEGRYRRLVYDNPIGKIKLAKLREEHIKDWRDALTGAPGSQNRNLSALKAALNHAVAKRRVDSLRAAEWRKIKPKKNTARRNLYLSPDQRRALVDALPEHTQPFVRCLCLLPLRPGALAAATVGDFTGDSLYIRHDKAGTGRTIALAPAAAALLNEQAQDKLPGAPLVHYYDGTHWSRFRWRNPIRRAATKAGLLRGVCAYTLRHSVITDMVTAGIDTLTVARVAGTSLAMIDKYYGKPQDDHVREVMEGLAL